MKISVNKNKRGIFYGFVISIGLIFLHELLIDSGLKEFIIASIFLYFVFIFEIHTNWFFARKVLAQMEIPQVDSYTMASQIIHHVVLPTIFYLSYLSLIYFYQLTIPRLIIFLFAFITFTLLFINIRAYYEDKFKLEEKTHYIYDIIKLIAFFQVTTSILRIEDYFSFGTFFSSITISLTSIIINSFVLIRHRQLTFGSFSFIFFFTLVIGLATFLLTTFTSFNTLAISFYLILIFYIASATIHHKLDGSLTKSILIEYFAVALLGLVIIQGLSN